VYLDGATIGSLPRHSSLSTAQWHRLGLALLVSLGAHIAFALLPVGARRPESPTALTVRVLPPAAVPAAPSAPPPARARAATDPRGPAKPPPPEPARHPVAARAPIAPIVMAAPRAELVTVVTAYAEFGVDLQDEKLDDLQRRVPRGNSLPRPAQPLDTIRPHYPREALDEGRKGHVLLEAFVDATGKADLVIVVEDNSLPSLAQAATDAVRRADFRPAEGPEGEMRSRVTLRVDFSYE